MIKFLPVTLTLLLIAFVLTGSLALAQGSTTFPNVTFPPENPNTAAKAVLGKMLFWDEQLSSNNTVACGTCHIPSAGGSDPRSAGIASNHPGPDGLLNTADDVVGSRGVVRALDGGELVDDATFFPDVQRTGRKTPSMIDAAFFTDLFWDGRAPSQFVDPETGLVAVASGGALESQAVGPPLSDTEMAHQNRNWSIIADKLTRVTPLRLATNLPADIVAALAINATYPGLFTAAFGTSAITAKRIAFAIATYERQLVSTKTPFDLNTLTPNQAAGLVVFNDMTTSGGRCGLCHPAPFFSDDDFHNIGQHDENFDKGRQDVTGLATDLGRMKTPSLRNVGLREQGAGSLFHNGSANGQNLTQVIAFYVLGGNTAANLDPLMMPLTLSAGDAIFLEDFLRNGLTDADAAAETGVFSRPTLNSEVGTGLPVILGETGFGDSMGNVPQIIINQPANLQHAFFTIGVAGAWGGVDAFLLAGSPNTGLETLFGFIPLGVGSSPMAPIIAPVTLEGVSGTYGTGYGSVTTGIANNPFYIGLTFFTQWVVTDPVSLVDPVTGTTIPGLGVSLSDVATLTILP